MRGGERILQRLVIPAGHPAHRPALDREPGFHPARPAVCGRGVVHHHDMQRVQPCGPGERDRLLVGSLVQFGVPDQHEDPRVRQVLGSQAEGHARSQRQPVAERPAGDLHPGDQGPVRVQSEDRAERTEAWQVLGVHEALGREHGVVRHRPVPFGEQETVPRVVVGGLRRDPQHAVIEHPEHVQGGGGGLVVLVVPGHQGHQSRQVCEGRGRAVVSGRRHDPMF